MEGKAFFRETSARKLFEVRGYDHSNFDRNHGLNGR